MTCFYAQLGVILGNKHQNNPLVGADTIRHSSTYIIFNILNGSYSVKWLITKPQLFITHSQMRYTWNAKTSYRPTYCPPGNICKTLPTVLNIFFV